MCGRIFILITFRLFRLHHHHVVNYLFYSDRWRLWGKDIGCKWGRISFLLTELLMAHNQVYGTFLGKMVSGRVVLRANPSLDFNFDL